MPVTNVTTGQPIADRLVLCDTFWKRGRGLMFRRAIPPDTGYLFIESRESVVGTTITMLFVFFPIGVVWLDRERRVVDVRLARPFRLGIAPRAPARYYLECHPSALERVHVGDTLSWREPGERR
jgi:uncharacterized membrane protein (UPF0127 family)